MSSVLHEDRLDNTVEAGRIGIGETVHVRTRMGEHVITGEVTTTSPWGLSVKEDSRAVNFYSDDFYLFSPKEPVLPTRAGNLLTDMTPDERVSQKLKIMEVEQGGKTGATSIDDPDDHERDNEKSKEKEEKKDKKDKKTKKVEKDTDKKPDGSVVDPNDLPDDIKNSIISTEEVSPEQLNSVLGDIGDAAMKALKRVNVNETEVHGVVQEIQNAVHNILVKEGKAKKAEK